MFLTNQFYRLVTVFIMYYIVIDVIYPLYGIILDCQFKFGTDAVIILSL